MEFGFNHAHVGLRRLIHLFCVVCIDRFCYVW